MTMLAVTGQRAVVTHSQRVPLFDIEVALFAFRIGDLAGVFVTLHAGFRGWPDAMFGGKLVGRDEIGETFRERLLDGGQLPALKRKDPDASHEEDRDKRQQFCAGQGQFLP